MKPRIFISCVSPEFRTARGKVADVLTFLGYEPEKQEIFGTEPGDLRQMLRDKIDSCHGLIQLVGQGYGAEPPPDPPDPEFGRVSYTQFEFLHARKKGLKTWLILPGPACQRDTPPGQLDLPPGADPDPPAEADRAHQDARRRLQQDYVAALHASGHLRHTAADDTQLQLCVHSIKGELAALRRAFARWQRTVLAAFALLILLLAGVLAYQSRTTTQLAGLAAGQKVTRERIRAHLQEASQRALDKDLAHAQAQATWQERERLQEAARAAHQQRLSRLDDFAAEFSRLEGSAEATGAFDELTRIVTDQGVDQALAWLESRRGGILQDYQQEKERARSRLQPLLSGAKLAEAGGDTARAHSLYRDVLAADPAWAQARHDHLVFLVNTLGPRAQTHETLAAALAHYQEAARHARRLTEDDPGNTQWQRDLSVSFNKLGDVAVAQGDLAAAAGHYRSGLDIRQKLAAADPGNTGWQRDLSVSFNKLGDVAVAQGDLAAAAGHYRSGLEIAQKLAAADPGNTQWQRDLSISFNKLGDVARAQGDLAAAAGHYRSGLEIRQKLAAADPGNTGWQRDLSLSLYKLGQVVEKQERWAEALAWMEKSLAVDERLAAKDASNVMWQDDVVKTRAAVERLRQRAAGR